MGSSPFLYNDKFEYESYLNSLYEEAESFLEVNPYLAALESEYFHTKVVGVSHEGRQGVVAQLTTETPVKLVRDPSNPHDKNAVMVVTSEDVIGFLNRKLALVMAPKLDRGEDFEVFISCITGGVDGRNYGVNLLIVHKGAVQESLDDKVRDRLKLLSDAKLMEQIRQAILGDYDYHAKQMEAIRSLLGGISTLAVFGTGRGKSAIFQTVAAYKALRYDQVTIIVYPLRALSNDQFTSMQRMFSALGLRVFKANGSLGTEERVVMFNAIAQGDVDIILTTPEFLLHHSAKLGPILDRLGLFVADESHHISDSHRPAYRQLDKVVELLGNPLVLAVTATADDSTARGIVNMLGIKKVVIDAFVRKNLNIVDSRGLKNKEQYVLDIVSGGKTVVYVGTRKEAVRLAKVIRDQVPSYTNKVGFYHGGMTSTDRGHMEEAFRTGLLQCMVATSAFGEGINVPDITDVVLYQMMYSLTEFNQMSGRAGRGGQDARTHLLFGMPDGYINFNIMQNQAPTREQVAAIYRALKVLPLKVKNQEIADKAKQIDKDIKANETLVSNALGVLEELGLIHREIIDGKREITVEPNPERVDLGTSIRLKEGLEELHEFIKFREEILKMDQEQLLNFVRTPIYPRRDVLVPVVEKVVNWL